MSIVGSSFTKGLVKSNLEKASVISALTGGKFFTDDFDYFVGMVPIFGFGEFITSGFDYTSLVFKVGTPHNAANYLSASNMIEIWPQVYSTFTEIYTQTDGATVTKITNWNPWFDIPFTETITGSGVSVDSFLPITLISISATSVIYSYSASGSVTGVYVGTLSSQQDNVSIWSSLASQANSLQLGLSNSDLTSFSTKIRGAFAIPNSTGGVVKSYGLTPPFFGCVASYGIPVIASNYYNPALVPAPSADNYIYDANTKPSSIDERAAGFLISPGYDKNKGFVVSSRSKWNLKGSAPAGYGGNANYNLNSHDKVYMQAVDISGGSVTMDATISLAPSFPNPIIGIKSFASSDAPVATGTDFGMLGFRSVAV